MRGFGEDPQRFLLRDQRQPAQKTLSVGIVAKDRPAFRPAGDHMIDASCDLPARFPRRGSVRITESQVGDRTQASVPSRRALETRHGGLIVRYQWLGGNP